MLHDSQNSLQQICQRIQINQVLFYKALENFTAQCKMYNDSVDELLRYLNKEIRAKKEEENGDLRK